MRTKDQANYALNRRPENRRIYAEQQIDWFYADLLKAQHQLANSNFGSVRSRWWTARMRSAEQSLAEAHASLDALKDGR